MGKALFRNLSLRNKIIFVLLVQFFLVSIAIYYFNNINSLHAEEKIANGLKNKINYIIEEKLSYLLNSVKLVSLNNESNLKINSKLLKNTKDRDIYFVNTLKLFPFILSSYFTTAEGYEYGASRGKNGEIGVFDLNDSVDKNLTYYYVNDILTRFFYNTSQNYDPTDKEWYHQAVEKSIFRWTSPYPSIKKNYLILSGVKSVREAKEFKGVAASSIALKEVDNFLKESIKHNINIIDKQGYIISSNEKIKKIVINEENKTANRVHIEKLQNDMQDIYQYLQNGNHKIEKIKSLAFKLNITTQRHYIFIEPFKLDNIDWLIIIDIKQDDIKEYLTNNTNLYISIFFIFVIVFIYLSYELTIFSNSLSRLNRVTNDYSKGEFQKRVALENQKDFSILSKTINSMAKEVENIIDNLEDKIVYQSDEIQKLNKKLIDLLSYDTLTKLCNRNKFFDLLTFELKRNNREKTPLTLVLCDIDSFREINAIYGFKKGDEIIEIVANTIKHSIKRTTDVVCRVGGEEFTLILPNTDLQGALKVANTIQGSIKNLNIEHLNGEEMTLSIGIITTIPEKNVGTTKFMKNVNEALYEAKKDGRGKIAYKLI